MVAEEGIQEAQQVSLSGGVDDLVEAREWEWILRVGLVEVGEVDTHAFLSPLLRHNHRVSQPIWVADLANDPRRLQLAGFLDDESLLSVD